MDAIEQEPRDTYGPSGTYGCACPDRDAHRCILIRYGCDCGDPSEECQCMCHEWAREDDDA